MSVTLRRMPRAEALAIANRVLATLAPVTARGVIVGSLRRERPDVGDIELLVEPRTEPALFGEPVYEVEAIRRRVELDIGHIRVGGSRHMRAALYDDPAVACELYIHQPIQCDRCGKLLRDVNADTLESSASAPLPAMRERVLKTDAEGDMQQGMSLETDVGEEAVRRESLSRHVPDLRRRGEGEEVLPRQDVLAQMCDRAAQETAAAAGDRLRVGAVGQGDDEVGVSPASRTVAPAGGREGLRGGTPPRDGTPPGEVPGAVGSGAPQKRRENGQQLGEPRDRDACQTQRVGNLPVLHERVPSALKCRCGGKWVGNAWGSLLAIRTGPAELGALAMRRLIDRGYVHRDGHVIHEATRDVVPTETEEQFFALADLPCVLPNRRDRLASECGAVRR